MPKRSSNPDLIQMTANIVAQSTGQLYPIITPQTTKNPAAVALGRLGGLKGGRARAKKLSFERRREIAMKAAQARWSK